MRIEFNVERLRPFLRTIKTISNEIARIDPFVMLILNNSDFVVLSPFNSFLIQEAIKNNKDVVKVSFEDIAWAINLLDGFEIIEEGDRFLIKTSDFEAEVGSIVQSMGLSDTEQTEIDILKKALNSKERHALNLVEDLPVKSILRIFKDLDIEGRPVEVIANSTFVLVISHSVLFVKGQLDPTKELRTVLSLKLLSFIDEIGEEDKALIINNDGIFVVSPFGVMRSKILHSEKNFSRIIERTSEAFKEAKLCAELDIEQFNRGLELIKAATKSEFCRIRLSKDKVILKGVEKHAKYEMDAKVSEEINDRILPINFVYNLWEGGQVSLLRSEGDIFFLVNGDEYLVFSMMGEE